MTPAASDPLLLTPTSPGNGGSDAAGVGAGAAGDATLVTDLRGRVLAASPAMERLIGRSVDALRGRTLSQAGMTSRQDAARYLACLGGGSATSLDLVLNPSVGEPVAARLRIVPQLTAASGPGMALVAVQPGEADADALRDATRQAQADERLERVLFQTVRAMAATIEKRDPYTAGHQNRAADLAARIGGALGLPRQSQEGLRMGGLIHDIGKIYVPAEILGRPGLLTPAEYRLVQSHPRVGHDIVKDVESPWPLAEIVLQHHERLDGSGYPQGLRGDEIRPEARILAVADVVEAMTSHRPYRTALPLETALAELEAGRVARYDADAVDACVALFRDGDYRLPEH